MKPTTLERHKRKARHVLRGKRGFEVYRGPSTLTGDPVVCVCKTDSENDKLGHGTFQTWILRAGMEPSAAYQHGAHDESICGRCAFRARLGELQGPCYVKRFVITTIFRSMARGNYMALDELAHALKMDAKTALQVAGALAPSIRLGAYGDPMAVPLAPQQALMHHAATRQAFTHSWADERAPDKAGWQRVAMASCELPSQTVEAAALGWRTYTAFPAELTRSEAMQAIKNKARALVLAGCPAAIKASGITCATCPIQCDGTANGAPWHVLTAVHGANAVMARYRSRGFLDQWRAALEASP